MGCIQDVDHFFVWASKPVRRTSGGMIELEFHHAPPLAGRDELSTSALTASPRLEWFNSSNAGSDRRAERRRAEQRLVPAAP